MQEILDFLRELEKNNNREWFNTNKERYQEVLKKWYAFCEELITEIGRFDADIATIQNPFWSVPGKRWQKVDACWVLFPYRNR